MKYDSNYSWGRHLDTAAIEKRVAKEIADHEARKERRSKKPSAVILQFKTREVAK
ncbi:hypothetical protein [Phyllobacterium lublinensis]|uniref:hypothetical protein n=1 Tax=Phyllobacterium lublinensis TaxID=2875708 RepID=UPI001CCAB411|nr:hypothetical protein [Phyllobacterium sp. 2063]MBZ9654031.1 hypothetical protein [Phyllobacterium sp. 2063]